MPNEDDASGLVEYMKTLTDTQGVSVTTVKDGWVFLFSAQQLKTLLDNASQGDGVAAVFVKSSALQPKH